MEIPVRRERVRVASVDGKSEIVTAESGRVRIELRGDVKMPPPLILIDRKSANWWWDLKRKGPAR